MLLENTPARVRVARKFVGTALLIGVSGVAFAHPGSLDSHFGVDGVASLSMPADVLPSAEPLAIDQKNRIIFASTTVDGDYLVGALTAEAKLDATFGTAGFVIAGGQVVDLKVDSKNRIVVIQTDDSGPEPAISISRYLSDGSLDAGFGTSGTVGVADTDQAIFANHGGLGSDDSIFVVGMEITSAPTLDTRMLVVKVDADGKLAKSFAGGGLDILALMPAGTESSVAQSIVEDADKNLIVAGSTSLPGGPVVATVAKLLPDGTLDSTFGSGHGFVQTDALATVAADHYTFIQDVTLGKDGKIVTAGYAGEWAGSGNSVITRYTKAGDMDGSFDGGSPLMLTSPSFTDSMSYSVLIDGYDRIVATEMAFNYSPDVQKRFAIHRINPDGTLDASFGDGSGFATFPGDVVGAAGAFAHGGNIILFGNAMDYTSLVFSSVVAYDMPSVSPPSHFFPAAKPLRKGNKCTARHFPRLR